MISTGIIKLVPDPDLASPARGRDDFTRAQHLPWRMRGPLARTVGDFPRLRSNLNPTRVNLQLVTRGEALCLQ